MNLARYQTETARERFGALVQAQREDHGWTTHALAQRSGLSQRTISSVEAGESDPQLSTMRSIAEALGHDLSDFLRYADL